MPINISPGSLLSGLYYAPQAPYLFSLQDHFCFQSLLLSFLLPFSYEILTKKM